MSEDSLKKEVASVGKNSLIYLVGPAVSKLVGFLLIPIYTKFIAPNEYGIMSLADILMTIAMIDVSFENELK